MMDLKYIVGVRKSGKRDCPVCGHWVHRSAERCPKCGHVFAPPGKCPRWVGYVVLGFFIWALVETILHW